LRKLSPALRELSNRLEREINPNIYSPSSFTEKLKAGDDYISNVTNGKKLWIIGDDNELTAMA
jgi:hypothetical protein